MQGVSVYTFRADETRRLVLHTSINRRMLTTTRPLARFLRREGAGTSFWSPELNRYYAAAPATDKQAAILVYAPQD